MNSKLSYQIENFDFKYPEELVAQQTLSQRNQSRMLLLNRAAQSIQDQQFKDLASQLPPNSLLVLNESRVIPARLYGQLPSQNQRQNQSQAKVEILLTRQISEYEWLATGQPLKKLKSGRQIQIFTRNGQNLSEEKIEVLERVNAREIKIRLPDFKKFKKFEDWIKNYGQMPLPPYIKREEIQESDFERYQTVFAKKLGSAAAPTASLHFDQAMLDELESKGHQIVKVCLHVGLGTFLPIQSEDIRDHKMHSEYYELSEDSCQKILAAQEKNRPVIPIGTTALRVIETVFGQKNRRENKEVQEKQLSGWTNLYIQPGYTFQVATGLLTNFHQPASSLFVLVSSLAGLEYTHQAYQEAFKRKYRLFSYGDCMLIL